MKMSPELLNLQAGVSWEKEFSLNQQSLLALISEITRPFMQLVDARGAHFTLFSDRKPAQFFVGDGRVQATVLEKMELSLAAREKYRVFTKASNPRYFVEMAAGGLKQSLKSTDSEELQYCLVIQVHAKAEKIRGYCAFYGSDMRYEDKRLSTLVDMFVQSITDKLTLQKYKRLNQDREELQELIVNSQQHAIFAKDPELKIVLGNQRFLSYYPESMQDKIIGFTTAEDYDEAQKELFWGDDREAFATGMKKRIETIDFPNGEQAVLQTSKKKFKTSAGNEYILGISYDLTEQYKLIDELKRKNKDFDQISQMLMSDVRAPANAMLKLITWLEDDLLDDKQNIDANIDNKEISDNLQQLKLRTVRINKLLSGIHRYLLAGRDQHVAAEIRLTTLVSDILSNLDPKVGLKTSVDDVVLTLPQGPFTEVLSALLENAIEHNTNESPALSIEAKKTNKHYLISVSDNGPGIAEGMQERIFTLFESSKANNELEVFGIGLAIARKIVESYSGRISLASADDLVMQADNAGIMPPKTGTCFVIQWPLQA